MRTLQILNKKVIDISFKLLFYLLPGIYIYVLITKIIQKSLKYLTPKSSVVYNKDPLIVNIVHTNIIPLFVDVPTALL